MTQAKIYEFLKEHPNELFTSEEIASKINRRASMAARNLSRAMRWYSIFRVFRGNTPFYVYINKPKHRFKPRTSKQKLNENTMRWIE